MKTTTLFLLITLFCSVAACKKDDNNDPDCVKEENYFTAEFGGQTLEPYWHTGFGTTGYTLNINRNSKIKMIGKYISVLTIPEFCFFGLRE